MKKATKKFGKKIAPHIYEKARSLKQSLHELRQDVKAIKARVDVSDDRLTKLKDTYKQADPYQPIYGIQGVGEPQRGSRDRCEAIYDFFNHDVRGARVLDVGSFFGYLSFYLAERGAKVEAWDNNHTNVEVAKLAQDITGIPADLKLKEFNKETVETIQPGQYDAVFILSVLHWTTALQGLEYVQDCMKILMDRVPMVVVELAQKGEDNNLYWDKAVPENDLDIFVKISGYSIEKIGDFPTHLSSKKRPIYVIRRNSLKVNEHLYPVKEYKLKAYPKAADWRPVPARYYIGQDVFIKEYNYDGKIEETRRYLINEINFFLQNSSEHNKEPISGVPKLVDYEIKDHCARVVLELIEGKLLSQVQKELTATQRNKIALDLLDIMAGFENNGLYHNDLRSWNVMVGQDKKVYLVDMEMVSIREYENNVVSYFWVLWFLTTGQEEEKTRNKTELPPRADFIKYSQLLKLYDSARSKGDKISFKELKIALSKKGQAKSTKV